MTNQSIIYEVDPKLYGLFDIFRDKITKYLFSKNLDLIDKFIAGENVKFDKEKLENILQGDWSRKHLFKDVKYEGLDLEEVFLSNTKNPKQTISKTRLFDELIKELKRVEKITSGYVHSFNPVLYFLLYDLFLDTDIFIKKPFGKKTITIIFRLFPYCSRNENEEIIGILFDRADFKETIREELLRSIEMYSMYVLNPSIRDDDIMSDDKFANFYLKNAYIQYPINTKYLFNKMRYPDLAFIIKKNPNDEKAIDVGHFTEILEYQHSIIGDKIREIKIKNMGNYNFIHININDFTLTKDIFENNFVKYLKLLFKAGHKYEAVTIFMIEIKKLMREMSIFSVKMKMGLLDYKLSSLTNMGIFEQGTIDIKTLMKKLYSKINPDEDFTNWNIVYNSQEIKKLIEDNEGVDEKKMKRIILTSDYAINNLILSKESLIKILAKIDEDMWPEQSGFFKYVEQINEKFIDAIISFLEDNTDDLIEDYKQYDYLKEYRIHKDSLTVEDFKIIKKIFSDKKILKDYNKTAKPEDRIEKLHNTLPFLRYDFGKFVRWDVYCCFVFRNLTDEEVEKIRKNEACAETNYFEGEMILCNYSILPPSLLKSLVYKYKYKYLNDNDSCDFIDDNNNDSDNASIEL